MAGKLRWKRQASERGIARIGAAPRGWNLHDGEQTYGSVYPKGGSWRGPQTGWYWVAHGPGIERRNTSADPVETPEEAKAAAMAHVKDQLTRATQPLPPQSEDER